MFKPEDLFELEQWEHRGLFQGVNHAWEVLPKIRDYLKNHLKPARHHSTLGQPYIEENVFIGEGTVVEHGAVIKGPAIIGKNCEIRSGCYIRGQVIAGDECVLGNSSEFKNCVLMNHVEVPHYNYVGDSILGNYSHIGAGVILSNLKLSRTNIVVREGQNQIDTGLRKFGAILGDRAEVGCNAVLNPGSILGKRALVFPLTSFVGYCPPNKMVRNRQSLQVVDRMD